MNNTYILIEFPDVQEYMEEKWFNEEAILGDSSSYFIPESRFINNKYIVSKCKDLANELVVTDEQLNANDDEWESAFPFEGGMSDFECLMNLKLTNDGK